MNTTTNPSNAEMHTTAATARTEERWWAWHDADPDRWSPGEDAAEATADAERRCAAWVAGESDDGPEGANHA